MQGARCQTGSKGFRRLSAPSLVALLFLSTRLSAGDWPQILGPQRNGIASADERLADRWPSSGPRVIWERPVGSGYAGIATQGTRGILFHRLRNEEVVEGFSLATGESLWRDTSPTTFYPQVGGGDGPLCVPTIVGDRVVTFGAQGLLTCVDLASGKRLWQRDTHRDYQAPEGYFGAGSSPIVLDDLVIVNVGGSRAHAGVVAFALATGEEVWKRTDEPASYSAPTVANIGELRAVLMVTRYQCLMLEPKSGNTLFQFPFGQRGPTVNAATPLVVEDHLLVTSSYGIGSVYAEFTMFEVNPLWRGEKSLATQYCTPILRGGCLYAIDGRDDVPPADFKCVDLATGNVRWTSPDFGYGTLLMADDKLIAARTNGELVLIRPDEEKLNVLSKSRVFRGTVRALPALSDGRLYLRDDDTLKCLHVGQGL